MAGVTYRGFDSDTSLARWGLAAVAIGIVVGATLPAALGGSPRWSTTTGRVCRGDRAPVRVLA